MMFAHFRHRRAWLIAAGAFLLFTLPLSATRPLAPGPDAAQKPKRLDQYGDPLPEGAMARIGTLRFRHGGYVNQLVFSPDGKVIYTACNSEMVARAWSVADGVELRRFGEAMGVHSVAISQDGRLLATGEDGNNVSIWDAGTGRSIRRLSITAENTRRRQFENKGRSLWLTFGPEGKSLITAFSDSGVVVIWDTASGKEIHRFSPEGGVATWDASKDGRRFAIGNNDGQVRVWDTASGKLIQTIEVAEEKQTRIPMALSPDGALVVARPEEGDRDIRFLDVASGKEVRKTPSPGAHVQAFGFSPDGKVLAASYLGERSGGLMLLDAASGKELRKLDEQRGGFLSFTFSPDSKILASGGSGNAIRLWDVATGNEIRPQPGHPGTVTTIAVSPDGKHIATCSTNDRIIRICDATTGREIRQLAGHDAGVDEVTFSPDGKFLASGAWEHPALIWDWNTGKIRHTLANHVAVGPYLRFSDDSKTLATGSHANSVALWDCESGKMVREIPAPTGLLASLLTFNDGKLLALEKPDSDDEGASSFALWDVTSNRVVRRFSGHQGMISGVILSADGRTIASRASDKTIRVWEVATGLERRRFDEKGETNSWTGTQFLAIAPDGRTLVSCASLDHFARRFDLASGQELPPLAGHKNWVGALEFSANGKTLATGSQDTTCLTWDGSQVAGPIAQATRRSDDELKRLWTDLQDADAAKAYLAIWSMIGSGEQAVEFLASQLRPAAPTDLTKIAKWIEDLDHQQFAAREKATAALLQVADQAEETLKAALEKTNSAEVRQRIRRILDSGGDIDPSPTRLREIRAIEVLETLASPAAREWLTALSRGPSGAMLTRDAQASLKRLKARGVW